MVGWLAKSALMTSPIGGFLKAIPRWLWIVLAVGIVVILAARWHSGQVRAFGDERYNAGYADAREDGKAALRQLEARNAAIAAELRRKTDEALRTNARRADALRLHGPGKATCANSAFLPGAAGRRDSSGGAGNGAVGGVPDQERVDLIGLPFNETVDFAEQHDALRIEALAWRDWWKRFNAEWEAHKAKAAVAESR